MAGCELCLSEFIAYDRGDGLISFIPLSCLIRIINNTNSFYLFLAHHFVTFDIKNESLEKLRERMFEASRCGEPVISEIREREIDVLNRFLLAGRYDTPGECYRGLNYKTMHSIKYKALRKLGVGTISSMIRIKNMWDNYMSPLCFQKHHRVK